MKKTDKITVKCVFEGEENLQEILLHSFKLFMKNKIENINIIQEPCKNSVNNK